MSRKSVKKRAVQGVVLALTALTLPHALPLDPEKTLTQYERSAWSNKNGLSQIAVMSIAQTPDGFLWLATEEGLVRFDGATFVTFDERNAPGLPDRFIRSLATAADGSLWIGTRSGIARLRGGRFENFQRATAFYQDVYDLCAGRNGSLWFSSADGLHSYKSGVRRIFTTADGLPHNGITAIAEAPDGAIWIGTRSGLVRYQGERFTVYGNRSGPQATSINTLTVSRGGDIWFGTLDGEVGFWRQGSLTTKWTAGKQAGVRAQCIREDSDGNIWIALSHSGLVRIRNGVTDHFTRDDGKNIGNPDWIFEDRERTLWIGSADAGLSSFRDGKFLNIGTPEGLSSDHVSSVLQSRSGALWVGTEDAGLNRINGTRITTYAARQGLSEKSVLALLERHDGSIWVGSADGTVSRVQQNKAFPEYRSRTVPPPRLPVMLENPDRTLWLGFEVPDGLTLYRDGRIENVHLKGRVRGLALDFAGSLWIASYGEGLVQVSKRGTRVYNESDGLSSTLVMSVFADTTGTVWAGTALAGLNRLRDGQISKITAEQGLFDNSVGAIAEDDCGYLWITSSRGVSRVAKRELNALADGAAKSVHSESFGFADGLRSQEFSMGAQPAVWKSRDGRLWFATMGGVARIDPRHILRNMVVPEVHFEGIFLDGKPVSPLAESRLGPSTGRLEISFTAPSFVSPERVRFMYRLEGFEANWTDAGASRRASYTNLPPGKYRFEVRAANSDMRWGPTAALAFECRAYLYQAFWFRGLGALVITLLGGVVYRWRVKVLKTRNTELEKRIAVRTADLQSAVEAARSAQKLLWDQAMSDALTGLLNRRAILDLLDRESRLCQETGRTLSVILADVDHFKRINDTHGHLAGDQVLQEISRTLTSGVREAEKVGRYGGEEILIVLPGCSLADAARRADQLRIAVSEHTIKTPAATLRATFSAGVAEIREGVSAQKLIAEADGALYEAKEAGRNCVRAKSLLLERSEWVMCRDLVQAR